MLVAISLMASGQYRARDIPELARAVVRAAGSVTAAIDGRHPLNGHLVGRAPVVAGPRRTRRRRT